MLTVCCPKCVPARNPVSVSNVRGRKFGAPTQAARGGMYDIYVYVRWLWSVFGYRNFRCISPRLKHRFYVQNTRVRLIHRSDLYTDLIFKNGTIWFILFLCPAWLKSAGHIVFALSVRPSVCLSVCPSVCTSHFCRHYSSETVRRSILIFMYVIPNILKLCTLVSVCPSVRLIGQNWRLNLGNFSLIYIVNSKSCRHYFLQNCKALDFNFHICYS